MVMLGTIGLGGPLDTFKFIQEMEILLVPSQNEVKCI